MSSPDHPRPWLPSSVEEDDDIDEEDDDIPQAKRMKVDLTSLGDNLWKKRQELKDVVLIVAGEEFAAHKCVLAAKSEYFRNKFYGRVKAASQKIFKFSLRDGISASTFGKVIKYAYTETLKFEGSLDEILVITWLAAVMGFTELKFQLIDLLAKYVDGAEIALQFYVFSKKSGILEGSEVEKKCLDFIEDPSKICDFLKSPEFINLPKVAVVALISRDTFVAPEKNILEAVVKWKEENECEDMAEIVQHIRLSRFTPLEVFTVIKPTRLFTDSELMNYETTDVSKMCPRGRCIPEKNLIEDTRDIEFDNTNAGGETTIELIRPHLVNFLSFDFHPDHSTPGSLKGYSYSVVVSLENLNLELYSGDQSQCRGEQLLFFPTLPVKKVKIKIESIEMHDRFKSGDPYPTQVKRFRSHMASELKFIKTPFKYINKAMAPLYECEVNFIQFPTGDNGHLSIEAFFNQPYSASTLIIEVSCDDPQFFPTTIEAIACETKSATSEQWSRRRDIIPSTSSISSYHIKLTRGEDLVIAYVKVNIDSTGTLAPAKRLTIKSITCQSSATRDQVSELKFIKTPFKYINKVMAPLFECEVNFTQLPMGDNDHLSIEALLNQPYSASTLIIEVSCDDPQFFPTTIEAIASATKSATSEQQWRRSRDIMPSDSRVSYHIKLTRGEDLVIAYVKVNIGSTGTLAPDKCLTIKSIKCQSSATRDQVDMDKWGPFIRATTD